MSIKDYKVLRANSFVERSYIAYIVNNENNNSSNNFNYKKLLIIHNASNNKLQLNYKGLNSNSFVISDNKRAGILKLENTEIVIENNLAIVPRKSSTIIVI